MICACLCTESVFMFDLYWGFWTWERGESWRDELKTYIYMHVCIYVYSLLSGLAMEEAATICCRFSRHKTIARSLSLSLSLYTRLRGMTQALFSIDIPTTI
ncbi:hypothetical protein V8C37DRAFT_392711 [Trichoderma ceciliae]